MILEKDSAVVIGPLRVIFDGHKGHITVLKSFFCTFIFWIYDKNLIKVAQMHYWEHRNWWIDLGDLGLVFNVTRVIHVLHVLYSMGAQWLSGRVLYSRSKGRGFQPHRRHCIVSLSKNINPSLVLVHHRKTRPFITERLLMGHKESNQTNKQNQ